MQKFKEPTNLYVTVDTGINIGCAVFSPGIEANQIFPTTTNLISINVGKYMLWSIRSQAILLSWKNLVRMQTDPNCFLKNKKLTFYLEKPQFFDSHKGITTARSESLFKLIYMYSCTHYIARSMGFEVIELPVQWKGQMNKYMVDARIDRILGKKYPEHVSDAVGMGLFLKGLL